MVLPGFIDAHNHLAGSGAMAKLGVDLNGLSDPAEILATIGGYAASCPGSAVIRGSGDGRLLRERFPHPGDAR